MIEGNATEAGNRFRKVLQAFSRALRRETHVLTSHPDLVWQQMYNRLQWEGGKVETVLASDLAMRSTTGVKPWVKLKTPYRESEALLRTQTGHTEAVNACAFSPDGKWIVSASRDKTLKIWDAASGHELHTLTGNTESVDGSAFSPDGKWIVSASGDKTLKVWDATSGRELRTLTGHTKFVGACAFSPDGKWIVSASADGTLKVWDAASGQELHTLNGHTSIVEGCAFSPDGKWIVSASEDETLKVWDVASGKELLALIGHIDFVNACAFSPDGKFIVSAGGDGTLKVWDAASGRERLFIPLLGLTGSVDLHPWKAFVACSGNRESMYLIEMIGMAYGPIIVTATIKKQWLKQALTVRCPACQQEHQISGDQLGSDLTCPTTGCGLPLRLNPFVLGTTDKHR